MYLTKIVVSEVQNERGFQLGDEYGVAQVAMLSANANRQISHR